MHIIMKIYLEKKPNGNGVRIACRCVSEWNKKSEKYKLSDCFYLLWSLLLVLLLLLSAYI